ncbi:MAG: outer membrane efflux protein, partial [Rhodospirillales bacterium]|nr:outer membrane efflux protein [Rhodospirillales bacterium]
SEFLALARKERQLGNRSLIDVLSGETAFINATSDATSAETDVAIAVFTLLNNMGRLNLDAIRD